MFIVGVQRAQQERAKNLAWQADEESPHVPVALDEAQVQTSCLHRLPHLHGPVITC
jgi:hypothetical protein